MNRFHIFLTFVFTAGLLAAGIRIGTAQDGKVPAGLAEKAQADGAVLVLVGLKVAWKFEGKLSPQEILAQRQAIAAAQSSILSELAGTKYKVTRLYHDIPGIALEVDSAALAVLQRSASAVNVVEDRPVARHGQ